MILEGGRRGVDGDRLLDAEFKRSCFDRDKGEIAGNDGSG